MQVENLHEQERLNVTQFFNRFQTEKKKRIENIRSLRFEVVQNKNKEFWSVKR